MPKPKVNPTKKRPGRPSNASRGLPLSEEIVERCTVRLEPALVTRLDRERDRMNRELLAAGNGDRVVGGARADRPALLLAIVERYLEGREKKS